MIRVQSSGSNWNGLITWDKEKNAELIGLIFNNVNLFLYYKPSVGGFKVRPNWEKQ